MTTNVQSPRPLDTAGDPPLNEPTAVPVLTPTGVSGVAVYDRDVDAPIDSARPVGVVGDDRIPVETRATGSILTWIIVAIVAIALAYFLIQFIF
jgi:DNA mismatch repair protein MutH